MPPDPAVACSAILSAVRSGSLSADRLDSAVARVLKMKERLGILEPQMVDLESVDTVVGSEANRATLQKIKDVCGRPCD
jgi:beta-N-acetylhexosaminidase